MRTSRTLALAATVAVVLGGCKAEATYKPEFVPVEFSVDTGGHFGVKAVSELVTPLGSFGLHVDLSPDPPPSVRPDGETLLYVDHFVGAALIEDRFKIKTGEQLEVAVDGQAVVHVDDRFLRLTAQNDLTHFTVRKAGPPARTTTSVSFQAFGTTRGKVNVTTDSGTLSISPPQGADRYAALWGAHASGQSCSTTVEFDVTHRPSPGDAANFGFAVAPRSRLSNDQPAGDSVQYEQESPPDFPKLGSFLRPAQLPAGAWGVEAKPVPAVDVHGTHHLRIRASGTTTTVQIDHRDAAVYQRAAECGGVSIRAWGAAFTFRNLTIS